MGRQSGIGRVVGHDAEEKGGAVAETECSRRRKDKVVRSVVWECDEGYCRKEKGSKTKSGQWKRGSGPTVVWPI